VVSDLNGSLNDSQDVHTRNIHRSYVVPLGYEVKKE